LGESINFFGPIGAGLFPAKRAGQDEW